MEEVALALYYGWALLCKQIRVGGHGDLVFRLCLIIQPSFLSVSLHPEHSSGQGLVRMWSSQMGPSWSCGVTLTLAGRLR